MADRCANTAATQILHLGKEAVLQKKHVINQSIVALSRSVGRLVTVWKNRTRHTHTHTITVTLWRYCAKG